MKIIKPGDLNRLKKIKRFECEYCGYIFEADQSEYRVSAQMNEASCKCPYCRRTVFKYPDN